MNLAELSNAKFDTTFDVEIEHPKIGPTGIVIRVIGLHTEKVRAIAHKQANEAAKRGFEAQRKVKSTDQDYVSLGTKRNAALLAAATVDWFEKELNPPLGKEPKITKGIEWGEGRIQFSEEEAEKLYSDLNYDWLTKQVDEAVGDFANFTRS